jgi:hypothetical protein
MIHSPVTKQGALETWLVGEIATLTSRLSAREAGLLLLDAQITDLEARCAASQKSNHHNLPRQSAAPPLEHSGIHAVPGNSAPN